MNKEKREKKSLKFRLASLVGILALAGSAIAFSQASDSKSDSTESPLNLIVDKTPINREGKNFTSFAPVVKKVAPSVVNVFTTTTLKRPDYREIPFLNDPFLRRFFGDNFGVNPRGGTELRAPKQYGLGSGVIVTSDGYILTNNHVIENADEIKVSLTENGEKFPAKVIGTDPKTEVAVLKIEADDLPFIELGDSDNIEVGDLVLAVGNPFGVGQTVTMGMISALGRGGRMGLDVDYQDFIQTDAAINPGNSGGALVDAEGRLIGLNTFIVSRSGGSEGIGFAIPVNMARNVMENLVRHGRVIRGYLGVWMQDVTPALAQQFDLDEAQGVVVTDVVPRSPAEKAGLEPGDVILEFRGEPVRDGRHLKLQVGDTEPNVTASMRILRDGRTKRLEVTLNELEDSDSTATSQRPYTRSDEALQGVTVGDIESAVRRQLRLPRNLKGALVTDVEQDSAAYEAGLRQGDVILEINRKRVSDAQEAVELSETIEEDTVLLRIWSRGGYRYVVVEEGNNR